MQLTLPKGLVAIPHVRFPMCPPHRDGYFYVLNSVIMKVEINHHEVETPESATLSQALAAQGIDPAGKAAAVNNRVVPKDQWDKCQLAPGDKITIIRAVCGG